MLIMHQPLFQSYRYCQIEFPEQPHDIGSSEETKAQRGYIHVSKSPSSKCQAQN